MRNIEQNWRRSSTRRDALCGLAGFLAGSSRLLGQQDTFRDHSRVPGMDELITAFDFEPVAYAKIPRDAYDYTAQGVDGEFTLRRNREAFDWVTIVPKSVVDVSSIQTATEVLGTKLAFPIMIAPTAGQAQLHPQGELAMNQGATAASETPMIVSNNASFPLDKIVAAGKGPIWFQLYPRQQLDASRELVEGAQAAGARAIVVTVDQQASYYERQLHNRRLVTASSASRRTSTRGQPTTQSNPYRILDTRLWYDWTFIDQIRPFVKVPMLIKGVVTPEDAKLCMEHGLDGVVVSNHGGRSLDYGPATLEVLPEITDVVKGRIPVIIDSGFRRGSDVFKALALGAKAVCLGRVPRWGLAAYGAPGVQRVLEILQSELTMTMAQAGRPTLKSIDRIAVRTDFP
ncbi:MAG TPA: alpha-hydroxy acid oxidase [Bryobacteraceae bacterium]|nr:alpha-hydroxy acid oxidase [Bryobacteraceae bacterium]